MARNATNGSLWRCDVWSVTVFTEVGHRDKRQEIIQGDVCLVLDTSGPKEGHPYKVLLSTGIGYICSDPSMWGKRLA